MNTLRRRIRLAFLAALPLTTQSPEFPQTMCAACAHAPRWRLCNSVGIATSVVLLRTWVLSASEPRVTRPTQRQPLQRLQLESSPTEASSFGGGFTLRFRAAPSFPGRHLFLVHPVLLLSQGGICSWSIQCSEYGTRRRETQLETEVGCDADNNVLSPLSAGSSETVSV
jgi:hypothetical protein